MQTPTTRHMRTCLAVCVFLLLSGQAQAASRTIAAGQLFGMGEDIVLSGDDVLEVNGTAEKPCRIDADCRQIRSTPDWRGRIKVTHCAFRGLGSAKIPAIDVTARGKGDRIVIENSEFHACGAVHLANAEESGTVFRKNTLRASSMVPVTNLPSESPFARYCTADHNLNATISVIYKGDDIQIYNNTFDGGGKDIARPWTVPAIEVGADGMIASLRSNAFYNYPTNFHNGTATIRPGFFEKKTDPAPARLGYADYNLFFNPDAKEKQNYALSVKDKTERTDAGFGKHDVPSGGEKNAQVDPKFAGPIPRKFPFADEDIRSGKVTVSQILRHYRDAYCPAEGSPLVGAGDPADGKDSYIGAVGSGEKTPHDHFGRLAKDKK